MSLTLPLPTPQRSAGRPGAIRAKVVGLGVGWPPKTREVVDQSGSQHTIWWNGQRVGDVVELEQRMSSSGPYWALIGVEGSQ